MAAMWSLCKAINGHCKWPLVSLSPPTPFCPPSCKPRAAGAEGRTPGTPAVSLQTQYTFIYQALLEYYLYGDTELDVSSLEKHLQTLQGTASRFNKVGLEEEFRVSVPGSPGGPFPRHPADLTDPRAAFLDLPGREGTGSGSSAAPGAGRGRGVQPGQVWGRCGCPALGSWGRAQECQCFNRVAVPLWLQKLTNVRIMKENMRTGNLPANMKKARVIQIIPCKAARAPGLSARPGGWAGWLPAASFPGKSLTSHSCKPGSRAGHPGAKCSWGSVRCW